MSRDKELKALAALAIFVIGGLMAWSAVKGPGGTPTAVLERPAPRAQEDEPFDPGMGPGSASPEADDQDRTELARGPSKARSGEAETRSSAPSKPRARDGEVRDGRTNVPEKGRPRAPASAYSTAELPPKVAAKVDALLDHLRENDEPMPGYVGGRTFENRSRDLPSRGAGGASIRYREWDVNPKVRGQNRGAERLVTGSDGSAYYTNDHYRTFLRVR